MTRAPTLGYTQAVTAAALWGSSGIFAVHLFRMGVPPQSLAFLRPLLGACILLAAFALRSPGRLRIDRAGLALLAGGGGVAVGMFQIAYQMSIDAVGVPSTVALLYLAPAMVAAAAGPLLNEWPDRTRVALLALTLLGVWLSVLGADQVPTTFGAAGVGWGLLAAASYGAYTLLGRFAAARHGSMRTVVYSTAGSALFLAVVVPTTSGPIVWPDSGSAWALLLAFAFVTIAVAHFLFFEALVHVDAGRASIATSVEPVVAAILATTLLDQGLSTVGWLGIGLVVLGVAGVGLTTR